MFVLVLWFWVAPYDVVSFVRVLPKAGLFSLEIRTLVVVYLLGLPFAFETST